MSPPSPGNSGPVHLLLTVLGRNPQKARYALGDRQVEAQLAPLALFELLPEGKRPQRVVALCTPEAKEESFPLLNDALRDRCQVSRVDVPGGDSQKDVSTYLSKAAGAIPQDAGVELTVDVTHGFRHFSYLTYLAVLYLVALRGVRLRGAYYGLLQRETKAPSPFLDLKPLLALPRWFHALEVLGETGSALPMASLLREGSSGTPQQRKERERIADELSRISQSYLSGLPLEFGQRVRHFREQRTKALGKLLSAEHLPLASELVKRLAAIMEPFALANDAAGDGWKGRVALSEAELGRQARIIDDLVERDSVATALGLLNEWTVSWALWRQGPTVDWLDFHGSRRFGGNLLGAMAAVRRDPALRRFLSDEQVRLAGFWEDLCELRNAFHHHGMRRQILVGDRQVEEKLTRVKEYWRTVLSSCPKVSLEFGPKPGGRVLVSPLGRRPGALFSAIHATTAGERPALKTCLVICSPETEALIPEVTEKARFAGVVEPLLLEDAVGGRAEIKRLVTAARPFLLSADEVLVNVTGGTTLMGLAAEAVGAAARRLARPVRRFGLIDRRLPDHQDADPYQVGEPFWLADERDRGDDD